MRSTIPVLLVSLAVSAAYAQAQAPRGFQPPVFGQAPSTRHPLTELPLPTLRGFDFYRFDVALVETCPMPVFKPGLGALPMPVAKGGPTAPMPVWKPRCTNPLE